MEVQIFHSSIFYFRSQMLQEIAGAKSQLSMYAKCNPSTYTTDFFWSSFSIASVVKRALGVYKPKKLGEALGGLLW